jgi:flagellar hook-associated protein 3 FlgL
MPINPFIPGSISSTLTGSRFAASRQQLNELQRQMATGKIADSYGGLGLERRTSLSVRAKLSTLEGYGNSIQDAQLRLRFMMQSLEGIAKNVSQGKSDMPPMDNFQLGPDGRTNGQLVAEERLKQSIDQLNIDVNGRYLFSGRSSDVKPVEGFDLIMNGDGTRAGLKQMILERSQADLGVAGIGRLNLSTAGTTVTLADTAGLPYGFKVGGGYGNGTNITSTYTGGSPASIAFNVATQPVEGEKLTVQLTLPDGSSESIELVARTTLIPGSTEDAFQIGATPAATAANLQTTLNTALSRTAQTALISASVQVASNDFFDGSNLNPPLRVPGPPYNTAVAPPAPGTAADTVIWYKGDDTAASARATAPVRIDESQSVGIGGQANELGIRRSLAQFAAVAAQSFVATDPNAKARYEEMGSRSRANLANPAGGQNVQYIVIEFGNAAATINNAKERHTAKEGLLKDALSKVEDVNIEEVAASVLALQTRMQASYQTTAILSRLNLTSYL